MARRSSRSLLWLAVAIHFGACLFAFVAMGGPSNDQVKAKETAPPVAPQSFVQPGAFTPSTPRPITFSH
jgi:hypothetical protein